MVVLLSGNTLILTSYLDQLYTSWPDVTISVHALNNVLTYQHCTNIWILLFYIYSNHSFLVVYSHCQSIYGVTPIYSVTKNALAYMRKFEYCISYPTFYRIALQTFVTHPQLMSSKIGYC